MAATHAPSFVSRTACAVRALPRGPLASGPLEQTLPAIDVTRNPTVTPRWPGGPPRSVVSKKSLPPLMSQGIPQ